MPARKILVVIVNYRSADLTLRALASLARERADAGLEINAIVVENASGMRPSCNGASRPTMATLHAWQFHR